MSSDARSKVVDSQIDGPDAGELVDSLFRVRPSAVLTAERNEPSGEIECGGDDASVKAGTVEVAHEIVPEVEPDPGVLGGNEHYLDAEGEDLGVGSFA